MLGRATSSLALGAQFLSLVTLCESVFLEFIPGRTRGCSLRYWPGSSASSWPAQCDGFTPFRGGRPQCAQASPARYSLLGGPNHGQKPGPALTSFLYPLSRPPPQALPFSHLILATGSTGLFPGKFNKVSSREAAIQAYEDMVKQVSYLWGQVGP